MLSDPLPKPLTNQEAPLIRNSNINLEYSMNMHAAETMNNEDYKTFKAIYWQRELNKLNERFMSEWDNIERGGPSNKVSTSPVSIHPDLIIEDYSEEEEEKVMHSNGGIEENYDSPYVNAL
jgi:hypothetical protein